jgi:spoIIIJ-associated protein
MEVDYLESITESGKTFDEALIKSLMMLKLTEEQVNIEILDNGNKGFLGIGYSPVKIRVTKKNENNLGSSIY